MEREGYIEKIIYHNESNHYTVMSVEGDDGEDIFVGYFESAQPGVYIVAQGEYVAHPQYDIQFKVSSYEVKMPDDMESMERYLSSGVIKGIGQALAKRIIKKFKDDTFRVIEEEPERLSEVKGISEKKAREIGIQFREKQQMRDALMFLSQYGISPQLAVKIYEEYGTEMETVIRTNPYQLAEDISGVGFKAADEIAERVGIGIDSDFRIRSAVLYTLLQSNRLGYMYLPMPLLMGKIKELLTKEGEWECNISKEAIDNQIAGLQIENKIIIKEIENETVVYAAVNYYMELNAARMLLELDMTYYVPEIEIKQTLKRIEEKEDLSLDQLQRDAVITAVRSGVTIITGGPGTGKTTTINTIIKYFEMENMEIRLAAPTGRAAKRITEATGYQAQTIHRMLELNGGVEGESSYHFEKNASNPLETDVIIIDEMSMVDTSLLHGLLLAVMPGTRLIMVGDVNQLPSVGAGNVLRDMIGSDQFQVVRLTKIYRQDEESDIVTNAHKINNGEPIVINNKSKDFFFMARANAKAVIDEMSLLVKDNLPGYVDAKPVDIQVLTPMRKGELGVESLNPALQALLNPQDKTKMEKEAHGIIFREGDKVMQIKNNYKIEWTIYSEKGHFEIDSGVGVFNGDMGIIKEINEFAEELTVIFDDNRTVKYGFSMLDELELAYAITVHKSQGSEYPAVVLPILSGPRVLMNRNLLYTAVTRAKKCVVIVGNGNMIGNMIENCDEKKRYSSLDIRLRELSDTFGT